MSLTIQLTPLGSFAGALLIFIYSLYSLIYINAFRSNNYLVKFTNLQISLFIFLLSHGLYSSGSNPSTVLFFTRLCYAGAASAVYSGYRFMSAIRGKTSSRLHGFYSLYTIILLISLFMPGQQFFTEALNPLKSYSSVIKGDFFPILVAAIIIPCAVSLIRLTIYVLTDKEMRNLAGPIVIGLIVWFTSALIAGIGSAMYSSLMPNLWIGPTAMSIAMAFFTAKFAAYGYRELKTIREEKEEIYNNMIQDKLTGVYTRAYILESILHRKALNKRVHRSDALIFIDIDNFKSLNDTLGHKAGDEALELLGYIMKNQTRKEDIPARLGGDEFLILLDDCNVKDASHVAKSISHQFHKELHTHFGHWQSVGDISLSMGIVVSDDWKETPCDIVHQADLAMYETKKNGKNGISLYNKGIKDEIRL